MTAPLLLAASVAALGSAADCVTTAVALRRGFREGNPWAAALFGRHVVLGSAALSVAVIGLALWGGTYSPKGAQAFLFVFAALRLGAAAANLRRISKK
jgi:hypothetical protein